MEPELQPELRRCVEMLDLQLRPNRRSAVLAERCRERQMRLGVVATPVSLAPEQRESLGFNATPHLPVLHSRQFNSCALVGNSGILLRHKYGSLIDAQDAVIRINSALTNGYEQHVGNRTDFVFQRDMTLRFNGHTLGDAKQAAGIESVTQTLRQVGGQFIFFVNNSFCLRGSVGGRCQEQREAVAYASDHGVGTHLLRETRWKTITKLARSDVFNSRFSSTGELATWASLALCKHVHAFGFYTDSRLRYHYAEDSEGRMKECKTCKSQMHVLGLLQRAWPSRLTWHIRGAESLQCPATPPGAPDAFGRQVRYRGSGSSLGAGSEAASRLVVATASAASQGSDPAQATAVAAASAAPAASAAAARAATAAPFAATSPASVERLEKDARTRACLLTVAAAHDCACSALLKVEANFSRSAGPAETLGRQRMLEALARDGLHKAMPGNSSACRSKGIALGPGLLSCVQVLEEAQPRQQDAVAERCREREMQLDVNAGPVSLAPEQRESLGFTAAPPLPALRSQQFNSCALVGNSGILLRHKYGSLIDAQEAVIRIDSAITAKYERHVGNRTDFVFQRDMTLRSADVQAQEGSPRATGVHTVMQVLRRVGGHFLFFVNDTLCGLNGSHACSEPRRAVQYASRKGVDAHLLSEARWRDTAVVARSDVSSSAGASTSELAVWAALSLCKHVHAFGLFADSRFQEHYASKAADKPMECASCQAEMHVLGMLQRRWPLRFSWHIRGAEPLHCSGTRHVARKKPHKKKVIAAATSFKTPEKLASIKHCSPILVQAQRCLCSSLLPNGTNFTHPSSFADVLWRQRALEPLFRERFPNASQADQCQPRASGHGPDGQRCFQLLEHSLRPARHASSAVVEAQGCREQHMLLGKQEAPVSLAPEQRASLGFNATPHLPSLRSQQFNSCALVGNSGILLRHKYGSLIDRQEAVIRINSALTAKYERHVGNRTDFVFQRDMTLQFAGFTLKKTRAKGIKDVAARLREVGGQFLFFVSDKVCAVNRSDEECADQQEAVGYIAEHGVDTHLLSGTRWKDIAKRARSDIFSSSRASTGELAIWVALAMCKHVHVFGFYTDSRLRYHYAEKTEGKMRECITCKAQMHVLGLLQHHWPSRFSWHIGGAEPLECWDELHRPAYVVANTRKTPQPKEPKKAKPKEGSKHKSAKQKKHPRKPSAPPRSEHRIGITQTPSTPVTEQPHGVSNSSGPPPLPPPPVPLQQTSPKIRT